MAKDRIGNEIKVGMLVQVPVTNNNLLARVIEIQDGGIATVGGRRDGNQKVQQITAGMVVCTLVTQTMFDPTTGQVPEILCVIDADPDEAKKVIEMVKDRQRAGRSGLLVM